MVFLRGRWRGCNPFDHDLRRPVPGVRPTRDLPFAEMDERKHELAMAIDLRLADLWAEIFEVDPARLDPELLGWFLRAAYGQGYTDALRESRRGQLCLDLGYRVPDPAA